MVNLDVLKNLCRNVSEDEEDIIDEGVVSQLTSNKVFLRILKYFLNEYEGILTEFSVELDSFDLATKNKLLVLTGLRGNLKAFEIMFNMINNTILGEENGRRTNTG